MTAIPRPFRLLGTVAICAFGTISCWALGQQQTTSDQRHAAMTNADPSSEFARAMTQCMAKMDADMMAAPMTGDPDHDFSAMMIPHHQGAVDMAKAFVLHGKDPAL
jgi:uncharacterized protein (DUF305 family)